jgi:NAD(P)-dependent dehydrogenase (short-subunit alcohol dehydrogenase family)
MVPEYALAQDIEPSGQPVADGAKARKRPVVVVTGATAGVGRATARAFARQGADIALIARDADGLESAAAEAALSGVDVVVAPADVSSDAEVEEAASTIEQQLGPIDVWVNNAMTAVFAPFLEVTAEEYERVTRVTYLGTVNGTRAALSRMVPRNRGRVVQVGSALAFRGIPLQSAYCGAKHAIKGFTDSVRTELLHDGSAVSVGMVQLPAMNTPQFRIVRSRMPRKPMPVPPIYAPEIAARAIVWMAGHPRRRELWVGGITSATIMASRVVPGLLDHYLAKTAVGSQLTDEPADPHAEDNLWQPVQDDQGAHGDFDEMEHDHSPLTSLAMHRGATAVAAAAGVAAGAGAVAYGIARRR